MAESVNLVAEGKAPSLPQTEKGASYDAMLNKKELQKLDWKGKSAKQAHDFIRALDSTPGAWTLINGEEVRLYGSRLWTGRHLYYVYLIGLFLRSFQYFFQVTTLVSIELFFFFF